MSDPVSSLPLPALGAEDILLPFQLEKSVLRGRLVRLGGSVDTLLRLHDYPAPVASLLAQASALVAALGTSLKFDGIFTLQVKSDGPISMLVADVTSDAAIRAYAQFDADRLNEPSLLGEGTLVFTVDQKESEERYQGIVKLEGDRLTEAFQLYFRQSEQIPTGLIAAARQDEDGAWHAGCLMIQRMPREGGDGVAEAARDTAVEDDWLRVMALMQTCTPLELTDPALPPEDLLYRLFHEEGVRVFEMRGVRHECRCSRERVAGLLDSLPEDEKEHLFVDGKAEVTCQFCNRTYTFLRE